VVGHGHLAPARLNTILNARGITGVLLSTFEIDIGQLDLDWSQFCAVKIECLHLAPNLDAVSNDQMQVARLAMRRLRALGYRRIGLMLDRDDQNRRVNYGWLGGYLAAQNTVGLSGLEPLLTSSGEELRQLKTWLRTAKPDAVISFGPKQFLALEAAGLRIPQDLAFAALDVEQTNLDHVEAVTGINQNLTLIGATAIDILASQLYHNEQGLPQRPVYSMIDATGALPDAPVNVR